MSLPRNAVHLLATDHQGAMIYLDHNASAPLTEASRKAVADTLESGFGNPSSIHVAGQRARDVIEEAREQVAAAIHATPDEIIFTSGATEANHLAWQGAWRASEGNGPTTAVTTAVEHPSVLAAAAATGWALKLLPMRSDGSLDPQTAAQLLCQPHGLVSVMAVNNESGVIFPTAALFERARARGALCHSDGTQALGKIPLDVRSLHLDFLSLSGHKIGALKGVGALWARRGAAIEALLSGHQEHGLRAGTENVVGIASFGAAAAEVQMRLSDLARQRSLRDQLADALNERISGIQRHGTVAANDETGQVLNVAFEGVGGAQLVMALDVEGLAASSGAACASGTLEPSHVLRAMPGADARGGVRLSLGPETTSDDIEQAIKILQKVVARIRAAV